MSDLYAKRDIENLDTYCDHVGAMTREKLHAKSDIAAELAWRDQQIAELESRLEQQWIPVSGQEVIDRLVKEFGTVADKWSEYIQIDLNETAGLDVLKAIGLPQPPTAEEE